MRRERGGRRTEQAEAGGEDDERRPVVTGPTCVRKRFLECPQDGAIGACVRPSARYFALHAGLDGECFQADV